MSRDLVGERAVYTLNADHVLHTAVSDLLGIGDQLIRRLRGVLGSWDPAPVSAALYGSAARRDGGDDSDIDLLLIRPSLPTKATRNDWESQIETLRDHVRRWTGNHAQMTPARGPSRASDLYYRSRNSDGRIAAVGVEKMSVSFDLGLGRAIRRSAQDSAQSVSSWLAEAAADRLRGEALGDAVTEWEGAFGALTEAEIADADRALDRASRRRRSGAA